MEQLTLFCFPKGQQTSLSADRASCAMAALWTKCLGIRNWSSAMHLTAVGCYRENTYTMAPRSYHPKALSCPWISLVHFMPAFAGGTNPRTALKRFGNALQALKKTHALDTVVMIWVFCFACYVAVCRWVVVSSGEYGFYAFRWHLATHFTIYRMITSCERAYFLLTSMLHAIPACHRCV